MQESHHANRDTDFQSPRSLSPGSFLKEATVFAVKAGVILWGISKLSTTANLNDFIRMLRGRSTSRADSLESAITSHPMDELSLMQLLAPLSDDEASTVARIVGGGSLANEGSDKLHKRVLAEIRRATETIVYQHRGK